MRGDSARRSRLTSSPEEPKHAVRFVRRCTDQARRRPRRQPGLRELHRLCDRSRPAGLQAALHGRAPFHRPGPGLVLDDGAGLSRRPHPPHPVGHGGGGDAVAQSGAGRRAGRHPRPFERRARRFRRRQGLPPGRVRRLLHPDRRGDRAFRRGDGSDPQGLDERSAASAITASAGTTTTSSSSPRPCSARTRRCGSPPAAPTASAALRARATISCSTSSPRPTRSSGASPSSRRNARRPAAPIIPAWWRRRAPCR